MSIIKRVFRLKDSDNTLSNNQSASCPNCWGKQEYADQTREYLKMNKKKKAFVTQFLETYITGIKPYKNSVKHCPKCSLGFA